MKSIRQYYTEGSVEGFYRNIAGDYVNPHNEAIIAVIERLKPCLKGNILDLSAGTGIVSRCISEMNVEGTDPYLFQQYRQSLHKKCYRYGFKEIARGDMAWARYDQIICSYALHLCSKSLLPNLLYQLAIMSDTLIIISPSDAQEIQPYWDKIEHFKIGRTHTRIYKRMVSF